MANNRKAKNRHAEITRRLDKGVNEFNSWRAHYSGVYIELGGYDFTGRDLQGINLCAAKLKKADFTSAILRNADFRGANLNDAILTHAECNGADMRQCRLANADLRGAILDDANLYATIRDGWKIGGVVCQHCWISKDRARYPDDPDQFADGEFEIVHGGRRIRLKFPNGFQPIDLLALPYHAKAILERYQGKRIIFAGLSTVGEASLEFRVEDTESSSIGTELQNNFADSVDEVRRNTESHLRALLKIREEQTLMQGKIIETLSEILHQESLYKGRGDITFLTGGDLYVAGSARALGNGASADEVFYTNIWNELSSPDVEKLTAELRTLRDALEAQSMPEQAQQVSDAEREIVCGNGTKAIRYLKKAGKWAFNTATKIGADVAAEVIKHALVAH
jgi:hypothetical protein